MLKSSVSDCSFVNLKTHWCTFIEFSSIKRSLAIKCVSNKSSKDSWITSGYKTFFYNFISKKRKQEDEENQENNEQTISITFIVISFVLLPISMMLYVMYIKLGRNWLFSAHINFMLPFVLCLFIYQRAFRPWKYSLLSFSFYSSSILEKKNLTRYFYFCQQMMYLILI